MKVLFSLIIAIVVYLICGLIAWNIVYSIIDNSNCTIAELANYKIYTYSGITVLFITIVELCRSYDRDNISHIFILMINTLIATSANIWENIWESTYLIIFIIYNLINIIVMTCRLYLLLNE